MKIEISTKTKGLTNSMFPKEDLHVEDYVELPDGSRLIFKGELVLRSYGNPTLVIANLMFGPKSTSDSVSEWLFQKLNGNASELVINTRNVPLDKDRIKKTIEVEVKRSDMLLI
ncbi:hypothetical protein J4438_00760 [Candidatus Woesearchaeota archaeon]|nr:hypothetical protein [Candidatus Woesearchaeota archaeon]